MMKFEPLINFTFNHEYFYRHIVPETFVVELKRDIKTLLGGPRFPFLKTNVNTYSVVGNKEELLGLLSTTPGGLNLEFQVHQTDPHFLYYTKSLIPEEQNDPDIQIRIINNQSSFMNIIIHITEASLKAACPIEKGIHYNSKESYWDYILLPRNPNNMPTDIFMEDNGSTGIKFKNAEQIIFMDKNVFRICSENPVKLKEPNYYQINSDISIYEKRESAKRMLCRNVPVPEPGRFLIKELQSNENSIIQIIYI